MHQTHFCKKGEEKRGTRRVPFFCTLRSARLVSPRRPALPCPAPAASLAPMLAAAGDKILHGFYKTDTLDLTLTCYDGIGQECVKYENE